MVRSHCRFPIGKSAVEEIFSTNAKTCNPYFAVMLNNFDLIDLANHLVDLGYPRHFNAEILQWVELSKLNE